MASSNFFREAKAFIASQLRLWEIRNAGADEAKLKEIGAASDDQTLRHWLWMIAIVGAPLSFLALPLLLSCLALVFSGLVMHVLWFLLKLAMVLEMVVFALAVYLTWGKSA